MAVATLSPARALRRTRRADPRALVGLFLTLAALAGSVAFWVGSSDARGVLIATRDVPIGSVLTAADVSTTYIHVDDAVFAAAVPADAVDAYVGRQLAEPLHSQQILSRAQLATHSNLAPDQVAMTIPARPESAVNGRLRPGDAVSVLVTDVDKVRGQARTRTVLDRVGVLDVGHDGAVSSTGTVVGLGSGESDLRSRGNISSVTLALTADQARQLAEARRTGELDIILLPPPPGAQP